PHPASIKNAGFRLRASMEELETDTARGIQTALQPTLQPEITSRAE
ncbi:hypothetical protein BACCOP_00262, partial [Phocaeicola coprocola DSM 17136]